ncbi:MAG: hypothetical protein Q8L88_03795 [Bacteroidota bacterium]|nr:hypothetical protein [Bacteroidota bacterium]
MKQLPVLLVLLVVGIAEIRAQYNFNNEIISNPFALSYGVDSRLQLFVPDTGTQILFNPARAVMYKREFIVGKYDKYPTYYYPFTDPVIFYQSDANIRVTIERLSPPQTLSYYSQPMPTVDIALLKRDEDSYWLLQFTNITNSNTSESNNSTSRIYSTLNHTISDYKSTTDNQSSKSRLKLSKIFALDEMSYSYGIIGEYLPNSRHNIWNNSGEDINSNLPYSWYNRKSVSSSDNTETEPKYSIGGEFSLADSLLDIVISAKLTKGEIDLTSLGNYSNTTIDSFSTYYYSNNSELSNYSTKSDPTTVSVNAFAQKKSIVYEIPVQMILSIDGTYTLDEIDLVSKYTRMYKYISGTNTPTGDTIITEASGSVNKTDYSFSALYGILSKISFGNLSLQTGPVLDVNYIKGVNAQIGNSYYTDRLISKIDWKQYGATIIIPIMFTYEPTEWLVMFSGMNIRYSINKYESSTSTTPLSKYYTSINGIITSTPQVTNISGSNSSTNYSSNSNIFFNMMVQHYSGFKVQLSFKEDLSKFQEYGISMMYFF